MTHDELLAKINKGGTQAFESDSYGWLALSAVVELHRPKVESDLNDYLICEECTEISWKSQKWPCHTIEAIKEELI
jgi:hypothetical protein